jgi:hypothetical protein
MKIRVIKYSTKNGSTEGVYFTEDFEILAEDIVPFENTLDSDLVIETTKWDTCFPFDYHLIRQ